MRARDISKYIIEGILGEDAKEKVAIYGGSFRPPTKSDYQLLEKAIEDDPSIDKFIVYIGDSESEGLDQSDAIKIWEMYKKHLPRQLFVFPADPSPVQAVYEYSDNNPQKDIVWLFGVREGNSQDFKDVADRTKSISDYPNIRIKPIVVDEITEREVMAAAKAGKSELEKYIPDNLTYKEIDDIYDMLKPKQLQEVIYKYSDDIIQKVIDGGWEYYETMGNLPGKAAKVVRQAREQKKKLFTLAYERDSSSDPVIQYINVFWSDKGSGPNRDVIEGGTMQDYEDIRDAGQLNLNEVDTTDLAKFEEVIEKIVDGGYKQYQRGQRLTRFHRSTLIDDMKKTAEEDGVPGYFGLSLFPRGKIRAIVHFSDDTSYPLDDLSPQDIKDIEDAADMNLQEVDIYDIPKFEEVIEKIVDERVNFYGMISPHFHGSKVLEFLKGEEARVNQPQFTIQDFKNGSIVIFSDGARFTLADTDDQDIQDLKDAGDLNKINEVANKDLARFEHVIEKIIDIGASNYSFPSKITRRYTADRITDVLKDIEEIEGSPIFTIDKYANGIIVHFSDGTRYPLDADEEDIKDILDASNINKIEEVATADLNKWEEVLDMISNQGYEYFAADNLPIHDTPMPAPKTALYLNASKKKKKLFTVIKNISGGGPLGDKERQTSLEIYLAEPDTPEVKRFYIHNTTDEDVEDLLGAADLNVESIKEAKNLARFEELLNKVAEGDYYYVPSMATDMDRMAMQQKRVERSYDLDKPLFSYIWDGNEIAAVFSDEPENFFWIFNATKEDKQDLVDAVKTFMTKLPLEKFVLKEAKNIADYEDYLDRLADRDYYYVPALDAATVYQVDMRHDRLNKNLDLDKPLFSYFVEEYTRRGEKKRDLVFVFSDQERGHYTIAEDINDNDLEDLEQAIKTFMNKIPIEKMKETLERSVHDSVHELGHYKDITTFMNDNGLKLEPFPTLKFIDDDEKNAEDLFGKTAYYDPQKNSIVLYTYGRHPKDILRSFAHELVHVHQNHEGRLNGINTTNTNEDDYLENIEREAYEMGNILFRKWTDQVKESKKNYGIDAYAAELARLRENIDPKAQKKHKGKAAPFGSAYKEIEEDIEIDITIERTFKLYCDLNNVLSDGGDEELNWNDDGKELWDYIKKYDVIILSNDSNVNNKINFINTNLPERNTYIFKNKNEKQFYARFNTILIDNREQTIENWIEAGGYGIVHHNTKTTIEHLKQLGL